MIQLVRKRGPNEKLKAYNMVDFTQFPTSDVRAQLNTSPSASEFPHRSYHSPNTSPSTTRANLSRVLNKLNNRKRLWSRRHRGTFSKTSDWQKKYGKASIYELPLRCYASIFRGLLQETFDRNNFYMAISALLDKRRQIGLLILVFADGDDASEEDEEQTEELNHGEEGREHEKGTAASKRRTMWMKK